MDGVRGEERGHRKTGEIGHDRSSLRTHTVQTYESYTPWFAVCMSASIPEPTDRLLPAVRLFIRLLIKL